MNWVPICAAVAPAKSSLTTAATLLAAVLPFIGVLLGFWWTKRSQISADTRARLQSENSARSIVYAQLRRIHATTGQQLKFISGPDEMIWLTIHRTLFPSIENLNRLEPLTALETDAVTSFYYLYQEQISFLTASAMEVWEPELRRTMGAMFNLETDVVAFDYAISSRREALVYRLININRSAEKALEQVRTATKERRGDFPDLHKLLQSEAEKLGTYQK